jgi:hypothetical protein
MQMRHTDEGKMTEAESADYDAVLAQPFRADRGQNAQDSARRSARCSA